MRRGAIVDGCDAGPPTPYEAALAAAGIPVARGHDPAHVRSEPRPDRLAVTKALTAVEPDHPELGAARGLGIPLEAWQQVVADAAVHPTLVPTASTAYVQTAGWLVLCSRRRSRPVGVRRGAPAGGARRGTARDGPLGER
jgi:hypothetical protein